MYYKFITAYRTSFSGFDVVMKWEAVSKYKSEIKPYPHPRSLEGIRSLAIMRGTQAGFKYAEAFHLIREFKR